MLRLFVLTLTCVCLAGPVVGQSKSGLDDIRERNEMELRDNSRATRRAMQDEVRSFNSRPYVEADTSSRYRDMQDRQNAYDLEERLHRLEFEARERQFRMR